MTLEELKKIIQDSIAAAKVEIEKQQAEWQAKAAEAVEVNDAEKKAFAEKMATLEELKGKYEASLDELAKAKERQEAPQEPDSHNPFKSLGHLGYELVKAGPFLGDASDELKAWNAHTKATMTTGDFEEGGAMIPTEFASEALERVSRMNTFMANAMVLPMGTQKLDIPMISGFDESQGAVYGNTIWYWTKEEGQRTATNFEVGTVELVLRLCTGMAVVNNALTKFSPQSIDAILRRAFDKGMNFAINKAVLRGTGAGEPQGVLEAECLHEVAKATGQDADTFIYDNVLQMLAALYSMDDESIGNGFWYMNKTVLPQLGKLNLVVGTGGSPVFISNAAEKPELTLFGIPIRWSTQMSALGDVGDTGLFDPSQYLIGQPAVGGPGDPSMEQSIHLYFDYNKTAFRFTFWMDGQPWWPEEFVPAHGTEQSPFVTLAAR